MIIRSQDKKTLTKFESVSVSNKYKRSEKGDREIIGCKVFASYGDTTDFVVGKYSTEEKAIKVLDMICEAYCRMEDVKCGAVQVQKQDSFCFNMPSDEEVEV